MPGRGGSPRREEVEVFLPRVGVEERKLATLGLRWMALALKLGVEGVRRRSAELLGEFKAGDCGSGVLEAECRDRRLSGCERRFASLFVCRAPRGVPGLAAAGLDRGWFDILALSACGAGRRPSCVRAYDVPYRVSWGERRKARYDGAITRAGHLRPSRVPPLSEPLGQQRSVGLSLHMCYHYVRSSH